MCMNTAKIDENVRERKQAVEEAEQETRKQKKREKQTESSNFSIELYSLMLNGLHAFKL